METSFASSSSSSVPLSEELFQSLLITSESNQLENEIQEIMQAVQTVVDESDMFPDEDERQTAMFRLTEYLNYLECVPTGNATQPFRLAAPFRNIKSFMMYKDGKMLKAYIKSLYEKCMAPENQARYDQWRAQFLNQYLPDNDDPPDPNLHQVARFNGADVAENAKDRVVQAVGFSARWLLRQALKVPARLVDFEITTALDEVLTAMGTQWGQFLTTLGTSVGVVGLIAIYNLWCYHRGSQSLERTKKNLIDNTTAIVAGNVAGWAAQAVLTVFFGPLGFWLGLGVQAAVGIAVGALTRHYVSKWTLKFFDIPKAQALEEAYRTLGITKSATDNELSKKCRELCRNYHPDYLQRQENPPDEQGIKEAVEKFIEIQNAYKFIKTMREAERSGVAHDDTADWKDNFMLFVKNLISLRRKDYNNEEEIMRAIDFEATGFPPEETFAERSSGDAVDLDAPLRTVGVGLGTQSIANRWWNHFWHAIGHHNNN